MNMQSLHGKTKLTKESQNSTFYIYPNLWTGDKPSVELRRKISPHHETGYEYLKGGSSLLYAVLSIVLLNSVHLYSKQLQKQISFQLPVYSTNQSSIIKVDNISSKEFSSPSNRVAIRKKPYYGAVKKRRPRIYTRTLHTTFNYNILIVDDNPINLNILKKCLQLLLAGHIDRLELASNGVIALEKLNARPFDLVLLDIDMPYLSGIETTRYIRQSSEEYSVLLQNRNIPIVAVTTNDSEDSKNTYFQIGMNDCVSKPIQLHLLEETLSNVLMLSP